MENGEDFARETREYLQLHGVSDYAKVAHAPLREYTIDGAKHDWYEMAAVREFEPIDLIVVDGPPALAEPRARWPVLPLLQNQLADTARILLDDGDREGERRIVSTWCQDYESAATHIELEEGAYLLKKRNIVKG